MNNIVFKSILAPYFASFIEEKESLGYKAEQIKWILREFDCFFYEYPLNDVHIKKDHIIEWRDTRVNDKAGTIYHKYSVISQFCRYMCRLGYECFVPRLPKKYATDFIPCIFSQEQMAVIFKACDNLRMKEHHSESALIVLPALIRLLYSTGIRISEALSILNGDVDFDRHAIVLNQTKNGSQRLAPINHSMEAVLKQYIEYRNRIPIAGVEKTDSHLFVSPVGRSCARNTILNWFHQILKVAGIHYVGNQHGPRLHDIRHTAAVHSLYKLEAEGMDLYCCLPILATFMGHKKVLDTEHYIRLTQKMYPDIIRQDSSITAGIYSVITKVKLETGYGNNY